MQTSPLLLPPISLTWPFAPLPLLFYFVNLWALESVVSCCSFIADASVLLPIWSVPYLNNSAVQTHCLSSVQCTAESTDPTDCTASRYLHLLLISSAARSAFASETYWLCFNFEFEQRRRKLVAVLFENMVKITNWETLCLEMPSNGRAEVAFSAAVLHAVPCPQCPCSTWPGTERAGRKPMWAVTLHVQANHRGSFCIMQTPQKFLRLYMVDRFALVHKGLVVLHHLLLFSSPRSGRVVRVIGAHQHQLPAETCGWKGGRYTVREWVAGLTVNRSLFLLCHATPDDTKVKGTWAELGWCVLGEGRGCARERVLAFQENKHLFWFWRGFFLSYWLSVSSVHTSPHRVSQTVTPRCVGGVVHL